jgi:acyl phosphate:glycerol-3-phosphate acyltransferase
VTLRSDATMDVATVALSVFVALFAYACGSVPVGVLVARATGGPDPRTIGSGRTGATNSLRALGPKGAGVVVVGDLLKGLLPVLVARFVSDGNPSIEVIAATATLIGSARSVFLAFGGGRGVVTLAGTMLVILPVAVAVAVVIHVVVLLAFRYMSLASLMSSGSALPTTLVAWALSAGALPIAYLVYGFVGPAIVWIAHADNIDRLVHGTERRFDFAMLRGRGSD